MDGARAVAIMEFPSRYEDFHDELGVLPDTARAVAIMEFPSHVANKEFFKKRYENFHDELGVLPDTGTATAAIAELAEGRLLW